MKTSKVFQHADIDNIMLQAQNSLCGIIKEISDISRGAVDQHVFVVLGNEKKHDIEELFSTVSLQDSTVGAKQIFLEEVVRGFKATIQGNTTEAGDKILGEEKFKELFSKAGAFSNITEHAELNRHINGLKQALDVYLKEAVLDLAKKQAATLGEQLAENFNKVAVKFEVTQDGKKQTQESTAQVAETAQAVEKLISMIHTSELGVEAQRSIHDSFLEKFKAHNENTALIDYVDRTVLQADDVKDYANNLEHLNNLGQKAFQAKIVSLTKDRQEAEETAGLIIKHFKAARLNRYKFVAETIFPKFKEFIVEAELTQNAQELETIKAELKHMLSGVSQVSYQQLKDMLLKDANISDILRGLKYDLGPQLKTSGDSIGVPADIQKCCKERLAEATVAIQGVTKLIDAAVDTYNTAIHNEATINKATMDLINDIPHAISDILGSLYQSTTGSSRFF
jgi:hypothetical protein